jgi:hypothetical protein
MFFSCFHHLIQKNVFKEKYHSAEYSALNGFRLVLKECSESSFHSTIFVDQVSCVAKNTFFLLCCFNINVQVVHVTLFSVFYRKRNGSASQQALAPDEDGNYTNTKQLHDDHLDDDL